MHERTCSIPGCTGTGLLVRDWCDFHYRRWLRTGDPLKTLRPRRKTEPLCSVDGCGKAVKTRGWCSMHYLRWSKTGDPGEAAPRRAPNGQGHHGDNGYVMIQIDKRSMLQHRMVMEKALGRELLPTETVHHINGVRHDNRVENLELWSKAQPAGQRVADKVRWAREILDLYGDLFD